MLCQPIQNFCNLSEYIPIQLTEYVSRSFLKFQSISEILMYYMMNVRLLVNPVHTLIINASKNYFLRNSCLKESFAMMCQKAQLPFQNFETALLKTPICSKCNFFFNQKWFPWSLRRNTLSLLNRKKKALLQNKISTNYETILVRHECIHS